MNIISIPPPNLKPPPVVVIKKKPRRNLTIKGEEFEEWEKIKGNHSWTGIMIEARRGYLKIQKIDLILQNLSQKGVPVGKDVWDDFKKPPTSSTLNTKEIRGKMLQKELIDEMKRVFGNKESILKPVPKEELDAIKQARVNRVKEKLQSTL